MRRPKNIISRYFSRGLKKLLSKKKVRHFQSKTESKFSLKDWPKYQKYFDRLQWVNTD